MSRKRKPTPGVSRAKASIYEAGGATRRTLRWSAPMTSPNSLLGSLTTLRDRSRQAVRDDGYAAGALNKLVYNIIGTGITPLSMAEDLEFRRDVQDLWLQWTDDSDADGCRDWYGQQQQIVRCWLEAGEAFVRIRPRRPEDGLSVPIQIQVLEPEMCPYTHTGLARGRNRIRAGIEFDPIGRRVAYYFYASRPGEMMEWDARELRRIPANQILHIFKPMRAGQLRGLPHLTPALIRLRELDKFDDATLIRQQLSAMFVAFLKPAADASSSVMPLTGDEVDTTRGDRPVLGLEPGLFQELQPGETVEFSDPPDVLSGYKDFIRQQLLAVSAATGVPYEVLTGDMTNVSDRTVRVILHEFRRALQAEQHQTVAFQLCRPVWSAWMDHVFLSGPLQIDRAYLKDSLPWDKVQWMPQGWPYIHPVQDVQAAKAAIRSGLTSRAAVVSEQGEDAEAVDASQAADNARADELGLEYDSDARGGDKDPFDDKKFGEENTSQKTVDDDKEPDNA